MKLPVRPGPAPLRARIPKVRPRPPRPVADEIVRVLVEAGVDHLFGVPGGPLMPFSMAVARAGTIRWVLGAHELGAAFMAEGFFRASQRQAACAFTAGP